MRFLSLVSMSQLRVIMPEDALIILIAPFSVMNRRIRSSQNVLALCLMATSLELPLDLVRSAV